MGLDRVVEDLGRRIAQRRAALEYLVRGRVRVRVRVRARARARARARVRVSAALEQAAREP